MIKLNDEVKTKDLASAIIVIGIISIICFFIFKNDEIPVRKIEYESQTITIVNKNLQQKKLTYGQKENVNYYIEGGNGKKLAKVFFNRWFVSWYSISWYTSVVIDWIYFNDNNIYIGFSDWDRYWEGSIRELALQGNKAINFECHVWCLSSEKYNIRQFIKTDNIESYYYEVTARYEEIK